MVSSYTLLLWLDVFKSRSRLKLFLYTELCNAKPDDKRLDVFYDYLKNVTELALFYDWTEVYSGLTKTMNACESFHVHFITNFNHCFPNVFIFSDILKNIQTEIYIKNNKLQR
jgi:hypothetical protein|uniref:Uncharacterized protein n=1 Tax=Sipha flava TaxID=143950 RepID=A0A2S2QKE0_9HEMI